MLAGTAVDSSIDMYAFGISMYVLYVGCVPFSSTQDVWAVAGVVERGMRPEMPLTAPRGYR